MKVFSMFDGVGGFIVGLNNADSTFFQTLYSNQYEPSKKNQDAYEIGCYHFPDIKHIPTDVSLISNENFLEMRNNGVDMIVGGFPCQDYSVARSKKYENGIEGKKGVLFWEIIRATKIIQPKYLILENVDRLLKSPSNQRGRDFAIMLSAFNQLNYSVEWRVINAADYGRAQRRRRIFFFIYKNDSKWANKLDKCYEKHKDLNPIDFYKSYIYQKGLFAQQFPINPFSSNNISFEHLSNDLTYISNHFNISNNKSCFYNSGIMRYGIYFSAPTEPLNDEKPIALRNILVSESNVPKKFLIEGVKLEKFKYLRGAKKIIRQSSDGHTYTYSEGAMSEFDSIDLPGRTILTSEGSINRSTHLLKINDIYRLLTPIEAERLQDFPDNWTKFKLNSKGEVVEVSDRMRMFCMGNALVTGIVTRIANGIKNIELN
jgi:DNA (cytosine-5)-methyltransferase 1